MVITDGIGWVLNTEKCLFWLIWLSQATRVAAAESRSPALASRGSLHETTGGSASSSNAELNEPHTDSSMLITGSCAAMIADRDRTCDAWHEIKLRSSRDPMKF